ncbi:MAG: MerR family transcriptional regulator [Acidimicrobiales bacterium]|nr:MerR family transcriptional regulator [Acidimicrobiales bacterium]
MESDGAKVVQYGSRRPPGYLSIAELAKASSATKATIHHYVALSMIPPPVKTAHNMAYYSTNSVEIIKLVRVLKERHVPLALAKKIIQMHGVDGTRMLIAKNGEAGVLLLSVLVTDGPTKNRSEIIASTDLEAEDLDDLESLGLTCLDEDNNYDSLSVELLDVLSSLQRAGLSKEAGFKLSDLVIYRDAMEEVVNREISYFEPKLFFQSDPEIFETMMRAALEHAERICVLVRRRILFRILKDALVDGTFEPEIEPSAIAENFDRRSN